MSGQVSRGQMWGIVTPAEAEAKIAEQRAAALAALNGREPQNLEEQALCLVLDHNLVILYYRFGII